MHSATSLAQDRIRHLPGGQHLWACAALGHLKNEPPEKCSRRMKATAFPYQPALLGWRCRQLRWNGCQERRMLLHGVNQLVAPAGLQRCWRAQREAMEQKPPSAF